MQLLDDVRTARFPFTGRPSTGSDAGAMSTAGYFPVFETHLSLGHGPRTHADGADTRLPHHTVPRPKSRDTVMRDMMCIET